MPRIDWEASPFKNPFGEDTPAKALARKWKVRILFEGGLLRNYPIVLPATLYLVGIIIWWFNAGRPPAWAYSGLLEDYAVTAMLVLFLVVRIQFAAAPAINVCRDTQTSLWEHYRMTTVDGDDVAAAMLMHSLSYGAVPLAVLSLMETVFYILIVSAAEQPGTLALTRAPVILILYLGYGLVFSGFGMVGALLWRHPFGVLAGVLVPMIIAALTAGFDFVGELIELFSARTHVLFGTHPAALVLVPENRIAFSKIGFSRHGWTTAPGTDPSAILGMFFMLAIFAALVWIGLWLVLRHRLRYG